MVATICMLGTLSASGYDFISNGLAYSKNDDGVSVTVVKDYQTYEALSDVFIPSTVTYQGKTYRVTTIGAGAFEDNYETGNIRSVTISNGIESIEGIAFAGCFNLSSITIPSSIKSIKNCPFHACNGLESIIVDANNPVYDSRNHCNAIIETSSNKLIQGCKTTIIPNGIKTLGASSFGYQTALTSISMPNSLDSIESNAFSGCTSLSSVSFSNKLKYIGDGAFGGCTNLSYINNIPYSLEYLGGGSFHGTKWLDNQPNGLIYIGSFAYLWKGTMPTGTHLTLNDGTKGITGMAFAGFNNLISVDIPSSLTYIGEKAFYGCSGMTSIQFSEAPSMIDKKAFYGCSSLSRVNVGNISKWCECEFVGELWEFSSNPLSRSMHLYQNDIEITDLIIPNSVSEIKAGAFYQCRFNSVFIPESVTCIGNEAFYWSFLNSIDIGNNVESIGDYSFFRCSFDSILLPKTIKTIGAKAFYDNYNLKKLYIPENVEYIGEEVVAYCKSLEVLQVDSNNHFYDSRQNCNAIISTSTNKLIAGCSTTELPSDILSIGNRAFLGQGMSSFTIPSSIIEINDEAFYHCSQLKHVFCQINHPKSEISIGTSIFNGINVANANLYVPRGSLYEYKTSDQWKDFGNISEFYASPIGSSTKYIGINETLPLNVSTNISDYYLTWESSDSIIASVDSIGIVEGRKKGNATVTAIMHLPDEGLFKVKFEIIVINKATNISLDKEFLQLIIGDSDTLVATVTPVDVDINTLYWRSSNSSIVTVDDEGHITAKAAGTATITVSTTDGSNLSASCEVTVFPQYALQLDKTLSHTRGALPEVVELAIGMINQEEITGLQFDLYLPDGVTMGYLNGLPDVWLDEIRKGRNHSVDVTPTANGYRVLVSSPTNRVFSGHSGDVLHMNVVLSQFHPIGNYVIKLNNIILAEPDETQHKPSYATTGVQFSYLLGDADSDVSVDVADYTITALHILSRNPEHFYSDAADVNDDNNINVADLIGITNIGLGIRPQELHHIRSHVVSQPLQSTNKDFSISAHILSHGQLELSLSNNCAIAGLQCDLDLPPCVHIYSMELLGRAAKHQLSTATLPNGSVRLLISAYSNCDIEPGEEPILRIMLDGAPNGIARLTDILCVERDMNSYALDEVLLYLEATRVNSLDHYEQVRIYVENGQIVIESPHSGTAKLVRVNGIATPMQVHQGRNVYHMDAGFYMVHFKGQTEKIMIQ